METINKKYDLKIEVLTPLSIGAGAEKDWVRGVDFVEKNNKIYKLNLKKMASAGIDLNCMLTAFAKKDESKVLATITDKRLKDVSDFVFNSLVSTSNDIKAFVKNQLTGKPLLTGSSLKGAVRSILFDYLRVSESDERQVFGSSTKGDEFMRFIKFSDAEFEETKLVNTKIFNLQKKGSWQGGWKHGGITNFSFRPTGFNTIYECIEPGKIGYSTLMISNQFSKIEWDKFYEKWMNDTRKELDKITIKHLQSKVRSKQSLLNGDNPIGILFEIINAHTKEYLRKEKTFFEKYNQADNTQDIISSIDNLLNLIPSDNSYCLLKMSAGSGFHSITGDWQFDDYSEGEFDRKRADKKDLKLAGKILPKSRKIAVWGKDHFDLMGFVKLTAQVRLDQEQRKKEDDFAHYYKLAEEASSTEQWSEVLQYIESAERIFPERLFRFDSLREFANANILLQKKQDAIEEAKRKEEEERRIANNVPLVEKIAGTSKIPTLCGNVRQWMKQNQLSVLSDDDMVVLKNKIWSIYDSLKPRDKQALKSFGKDLNDIIGSEIADKWFDEIVKK